GSGGNGRSLREEAMSLNRPNVAMSRFPQAGGSRGKKRPILVVQSDVYNATARHAIDCETVRDTFVGPPRHLCWPDPLLAPSPAGRLTPCKGDSRRGGIARLFSPKGCHSSAQGNQQFAKVVVSPYAF